MGRILDRKTTAEDDPAETAQTCDEEWVARLASLTGAFIDNTVETL